VVLTVNYKCYPHRDLGLHIERAWIGSYTEVLLKGKAQYS
jgi:hypothetical protein